jgi:hypothetical protein
VITRRQLRHVRKLATAASSAATAAYQSLACTGGAIGLPRLQRALRQAYEHLGDQIAAASRARVEIAPLLEQSNGTATTTTTPPPPATSTTERLDKLARLVRGPAAPLLSGAVRVQLYTWQQRDPEQRLAVLREAQRELIEQSDRVGDLTGLVQQLIAELDR